MGSCRSHPARCVSACTVHTLLSTPLGTNKTNEHSLPSPQAIAKPVDVCPASRGGPWRSILGLAAVQAGRSHWATISCPVLHKSVSAATHPTRQGFEARGKRGEQAPCQVQRFLMARCHPEANGHHRAECDLQWPMSLGCVARVVGDNSSSSRRHADEALRIQSPSLTLFLPWGPTANMQDGGPNPPGLAFFLDGNWIETRTTRREKGAMGTRQGQGTRSSNPEAADGALDAVVVCVVARFELCITATLRPTTCDHAAHSCIRPTQTFMNFLSRLFVHGMPAPEPSRPFAMPELEDWGPTAPIGNSRRGPEGVKCPQHKEYRKPVME
ncbi:uncharacterized protein B0H64DRAFT_50607 [Chaetomium fimeti]|uniref:Uncharacterized protein n=1 Tax=Chaetomium fimeti TaxID=1854472 RepID=A0AAE0H791_9PEZI|nr:hypothetical protein B0H64DRAFT_50607 [Chaetomium fimeti]